MTKILNTEEILGIWTQIR